MMVARDGGQKVRGELVVAGCDARITKGGSYDPIPGTNTFRIDPNAGRFAYSVSTNEESSLDDYQFRLLIDRDGSEGVELVEFNLFREARPLHRWAPERTLAKMPPTIGSPMRMADILSMTAAIRG